MTHKQHHDVHDFKTNSVGASAVSRYNYGVKSISQRTGIDLDGAAFGSPSTPLAISWNDYRAVGAAARTKNALTDPFPHALPWMWFGNGIVTTGINQTGETAAKLIKARSVSYDLNFRMTPLTMGITIE